MKSVFCDFGAWLDHTQLYYLPLVKEIYQTGWNIYNDILTPFPWKCIEEYSVSARI